MELFTFNTIEDINKTIKALKWNVLLSGQKFFIYNYERVFKGNG